ncbi:MAG: hypothetical protein Q7J60_17065 [Bradyrhizobium sp.]|nr:hypothetical protein [Bradyrhizobium sp.]
MLRLKILASAFPLLAAAMFAGGDILPGARPCLAIGEGSVQITSLPWQAQAHVSFTGDPTLATVRVQLTDDAAAADFAVLDDIDGTKARETSHGCEVNAATRFVAISAGPAASRPVIYVSPDGPADYRIFVASRRFSAREAAALIVGAHGAPRRLAAAAL